MLALQQHQTTQLERPPPGATSGSTDTATPVILGLLGVGLLMTLLLFVILAVILFRRYKAAPKPATPPAPKPKPHAVRAAEDAQTIHLGSTENRGGTP